MKTFFALVIGAVALFANQTASAGMFVIPDDDGWLRLQGGPEGILDYLQRPDKSLADPFCLRRLILEKGDLALRLALGYRLEAVGFEASEKPSVLKAKVSWSFLDQSNGGGVQFFTTGREYVGECERAKRK